MKAKEEYVDAPRETRSKDITVYAVIFLVLLVGAGIFLAVKLLHKPADTALASSKSGIIYDSSAVEGGWDNLSPEEIAEKLNEKVAEGMINISMNTAPLRSSSTTIRHGQPKAARRIAAPRRRCRTPRSVSASGSYSAFHTVCTAWASFWRQSYFLSWRSCTWAPAATGSTTRPET